MQQQEVCRVLQLGLLLSADADSTALGQFLEPRVASLPVATQRDLILVAHSLFHAPQDPLQVSTNLKSLLTQLLHVLSNSKAASVADSACWALQQQQQQLSLLPGAPLSWLERQHSSQAAINLQHQPSAVAQLVKQKASAPIAASISPPAFVASGAAPEKHGSCNAVLPHDSSTPCGRQQLMTDADAAGVDTDQRPEKRVRFDVAAGQADTAGDSPYSKTWSTTLQQLQVVVEGGDVNHLELRPFADMLAAAAAAHNGGGQLDTDDDSKVVLPLEQRMHLQQRLQALPVAACHVLLEELLQQCSAARSSSSSGPDSSTGGLQLPDASWALLLSDTLLPHLQQLKGAASNTLLKCLTELGRSSKCDVLVPSVLQPLVLSHDLKPVQVQLLVKLTRDVSSLQTRILELVLMAACSFDAAKQPDLWEQIHGLLPSATATSSSHECFWREPHAQLLKLLLELAPHAVAQRLSAVIPALTAAVQQPGLAASTVFGQLLMALVKQLSVSFSRQHVLQLQAVVARTHTFLSKTLTIRLQQLEGLHANALK